MCCLSAVQTQILRENINDQLNRLLTQLEDLEELKDGQDARSSPCSAVSDGSDRVQSSRPFLPCLLPCAWSEFSNEEYAETKAETLAQLADFQSFLAAALKGDLTLVDEFGAASLAIQAAVSQAFKTPEVIRLFAQRQPEQLRVRLSSLRRDWKVKKLSRDEYMRGSIEVLQALSKMGSELSEEEQQMLDKYGEGSGIGQMEDVGDEAETVNAEHQQSLIDQAKAQITQAHK